MAIVIGLNIICHWRSLYIKGHDIVDSVHVCIYTVGLQKVAHGETLGVLRDVCG